jgi:hypothetical protein
MKLEVKFHLWKDKDFTWHYNLQSEISHVRERISHEITTEISHVKCFARNYKLQWNFKQWRRQASEIGGGSEGQTHIFLGGEDRIVE